MIGSSPDAHGIRWRSPRTTPPTVAAASRAGTMAATRDFTARTSALLRRRLPDDARGDEAAYRSRQERDDQPNPECGARAFVLLQANDARGLVLHFDEM